MILVSMLLSSQLKRLVCKKKLDIGFMKKSYLVLNKYSDSLIYYSVQDIAVHCKSAIFYTVKVNAVQWIELLCIETTHIFSNFSVKCTA